MHLNEEDKKTHKAWLQSLKVGSLVEVEFPCFGLNGPDYHVGTVSRILPAGCLQVLLEKKRYGNRAYNFMSDGRRGRHGSPFCALFAPSTEIDAKRERKRLQCLIRARIKKLEEYAKMVVGDYVEWEGELAPFAAALQFVLHIVDSKQKKPEPSELVCPCGTCRGLENP